MHLSAFITLEAAWSVHHAWSLVVPSRGRYVPKVCEPLEKLVRHRPICHPITFVLPARFPARYVPQLHASLAALPSTVLQNRQQCHHNQPASRRVLLLWLLLELCCRVNSCDKRHESSLANWFSDRSQFPFPLVLASEYRHFSLRAWLSLYENAEVVHTTTIAGSFVEPSVPSAAGVVAGGLPPSMILHAPALLRLTHAQGSTAPVCHLQVENVNNLARR